ncbi:nitroreductase family protein [Halopolyspora algeriensis]|uniref:Nitroreductase family protein n=1 Tax=Halopolyspora algeriensis TaxID=1500506 RepID=A0A368VH81_9ACTN|nr:nitroreductase family protein [Halopolyspora algeriensis]RCW40711.1 nitroreductase family protein [Halopolyspora algeriensis]TQM53366.1 nitroreductase family protein [Halopolyspora algeriensis]
MSRRRANPRRHGTAVDGPPWTAEETTVLDRAVDRAPSVHDTRPWSLTVQGRTATLYEWAEAKQDRHDPEGRDRHFSCGAALANLVLAVRSIGWATEVRQEHSPDPPDTVAAVTGTRREAPTATEGQRYRAITRRTTYHRIFEPRALSYLTRETLLAAATSPQVYSRWVMGGTEASNVASLLAHAARTSRKDRSHSWELAMWSLGQPDEVPPGQGVPDDTSGSGGVRAAGSAAPAAWLPSEQQLGAWIGNESVLVLSTFSDGRHDHVSAGTAMQLAWLAATSLGLAASVITQPLHLPEVRSGLRERLGLPGQPQMLMRFGYPAFIPGPRRF